jgi:hypothetical protein
VFFPKTFQVRGVKIIVKTKSNRVKASKVIAIPASAATKGRKQHKLYSRTRRTCNNNNVF